MPEGEGRYARDYHVEVPKRKPAYDFHIELPQDTGAWISCVECVRAVLFRPSYDFYCLSSPSPPSVALSSSCRSLLPLPSLSPPSVSSFPSVSLSSPPSVLLSSFRSLLLSFPLARTHPPADEHLKVSESMLSLSNYPVDAAGTPLARPPEAPFDEDILDCNAEIAREGDAVGEEGKDTEVLQEGGSSPVVLDELSEELAPGVSALSYDGHGGGDEEGVEGGEEEGVQGGSAECL